MTEKSSPPSEESKASASPKVAGASKLAGLSQDEIQELIELQLRAGAFDAASQVLKAHLVQHPDDHARRAELCRCLLRLERFDEAQQTIQELQQHAPDSPETHALEALQLQLKGDVAKAKRKYEAALAKEPSMVWAAYNLARICAEQGEDDTCEALLDRILTAQPDNYAARFQRALLYSRTLRGEQAQAELTETINANPLMLQPYLLLSELRLRAGHADQAAELLSHGLKANPLAHPLREALARLFSTTGDFEAAFGARLELCRVRGHFEDYLELGLAALQKQSPEHAVIAFAKAIKEKPKDWRGYFNLAEIHRSAGNYEGALPIYLQALEYDANERVLNALGLWYLEAPAPHTNPQRALEYLQRAIELSPDMPEALYNRVLAFAALERPNEARAAFESLKKTLPPHHPLQEQLPELQKAFQVN